MPLEALEEIFAGPLADSCVRVRRDVGAHHLHVERPDAELHASRQKLRGILPALLRRCMALRASADRHQILPVTRVGLRDRRDGAVHRPRRAFDQQVDRERDFSGRQWIANRLQRVQISYQGLCILIAHQPVVAIRHHREQGVTVAADALANGADLLAVSPIPKACFGVGGDVAGIDLARQVFHVEKLAGAARRFHHGTELLRLIGRGVAPVRSPPG